MLKKAQFLFLKFECSDYAKDMADRLGDLQDDDKLLEFDNVEENIDSNTDSAQDNSEENTDTNVSENFTEKIDTEPLKEKSDSSTRKKISEEEFLSNLVADALQMIDKSKEIPEQVDTFLENIGFSANDKIIKQAFIAACNVEKIDVTSIVTALTHDFPTIRMEFMKTRMREEFKKWISNYPEAKEKYPKLSFMVLLKVFARNIK